MEKHEKIAVVKAKITGYIDSMNGQYDHISNDKGMAVNIKDYFPDAEDPFGSFIYKLYKNRIDIASPCGPRYSMMNTEATLRTITYDQLIEEDANMLYGEFIKN